MRRNIQMVLYLVACTLLVFGGQLLLKTFFGPDRNTPARRAAAAHISERAYYSLREVASVQLGHVTITYHVDQETGRCRPRYANQACANLQADPSVLARQQKALQDDLHQRILLLKSGADVDGSKFVTPDEGSRYRDLFTFAHLAAHCLQDGSGTLANLAQAAGLDTDEVAEEIQSYRALVAASPTEIRDSFPVVSIDRGP